MPKLDRSQIERLTSFIGHDVASEENTCGSYADIARSQLDDIAKLAQGGATLDAILYVLLLLGDRADLRNASSFVDNVTKQNMSVGDWLKNFHRAA